MSTSSSVTDAKTNGTGTANSATADSKQLAPLFPWPASFGRNSGAATAASKKSALFSPFKVRDLELKNRIVVSPMCQYSSPDGYFTDWHLVHLGSFAVGGAGLVFTEAAAVLPEGRISPFDAGIWLDSHVDMMKRCVDFIHAQKAAAAIQLAHAGRKASTNIPWMHRGSPIPATEELGWQVVGPSPLAWDPTHTVPTELTVKEIKEVTAAFVAATKRAITAGFDAIEIHGAHGYLITSFLSPTSNKRTDEYGGSFENRVRILIETVDAVRQVWKGPLFVRLSCHEWVDNGWTVDETVALAKLLKDHDVDVVDCSSGGNSSEQKITAGPGFQVPFAERVGKEAGITTMAVGMITDPHQAEEIVASGKADLVAMARELLRDARWPLHAAHTLGVDVEWPAQYERAKPKL